MITVGVSPTAVQGVAIAAYSGRYSRMWAWDTISLKVLGYQDIKARVVLRDITNSGCLCAYYVDASGKQSHYVAISRPPYFHALWLRNTETYGGKAVVFSDPGLVRYCVTPKSEEFPWSRIIEERTNIGCPFRFEEMPREGQKEECDIFAARCSGIVEYTDHWDSERRGFQSWVGEDPLGRRITVQNWQILADGIPFLDCSRQPFEAVTTPDWAKSWELLRSSDGLSR
jgi:hypothetical protein